MSRFFFDVVDQGVVVRRDHEGRELPGLEAAEIEASNCWKQLSDEWAAAGKDLDALGIAVLDAGGALLWSIPSSLKFRRDDRFERAAA